MPDKKANLVIGVKDRTGAKLARIGKKFARLGAKVRAVGQFIARNMVTPLLFAAAAVIKVGAAFEKNMNRVRVVTRTFGKENESTFERLKDQAKGLGETTMFSAAQVAEGMTFVAQAGFSANEILSAMPGLVDLAAAAQIDLASAANISATVLRGYNLKATESNRVADVMTETFTRTNTTIEALGEAFAVVAPIAKALNFQFEETSAALGILADAGFKGSKGGIALKNIMAEIAKLPVTPEKAAILAKLGIRPEEIFDAEGRIKSLAAVVKAFEGKIGAKEVPLIFQIFQKRATAPFLALIAKGSKPLIELQKNLLNAEGAAKRVAKVSMEGAIGSLLALKSAAEGLLIAVAESGLLEKFTAFVKWYTSRLRFMSAGFKDMMTDIEGFWLQTLSGLGQQLFKWAFNVKNILKVVLLPFEKLGLLFGGAVLAPVTGGSIVDRIGGLTGGPQPAPRLKQRTLNQGPAQTNQPTKIEVTNNFNRMPPGVRVETSAKIEEPGLPIRRGKINQ